MKVLSFRDVDARRHVLRAARVRGICEPRTHISISLSRYLAIDRSIVSY